MTCANGYAVVIDDGADIVGMQTIDDKRDNGRLVLRRADYPETRNALQRARGICEHGLVPVMDGVHADRFQVTNGFPETYRIRDVWRSRFKFPRQIVVFDGVETNHANHLTTPLPWWHGVEQ